MPIKDAFEMLIEILHGNRTKLMEDPSYFDTVVGVGIASILGGHEHPISLLTVLMQFRRVVMAITQDETPFGRDFSQQFRSRFTICHIGWSQHGGEGKPDRRHD